MIKLKYRKTYKITLILIVISIFGTISVDIYSKLTCKRFISTEGYNHCTRIINNNLSLDYLELIIFLSFIFLILSIAKFFSDLFYGYFDKKND